ncbi:Exosome complex component MTR3 [Nymphon striatum]|nr:Exosome complex component MTR3 [Nymphon striatum]
MSSDGHVQAALASGVAGKSVSRSQRAPAPLRIDDSDFVADFADGRWVVSWRWSRELPKTLQTRIGEYKCTQAPHVRERYNAEIQRWISKGWLKEWRGPIEGIIPLLAVFQPSKDKVRPVMDYRELNDFVECHTGDVIAVCGEKIREWRQLRGELKIVDLKSAYLQIHISENLWKYQVVKYKGVTYALTRLGFGLSCAPRIMTAILGKVLSMDERVRRGTDHYIDDIVVRESVLSAQELREHLARYGLESKAPEGLDGGRVLGISLRKGSGGHLEMSRGMALSEIVMDQSRLTKRGLFSLCGRLVGHYPVAGWLRPCCSFLKRLGCGGSWDEPVESFVGELAKELLVRARAEDPVRGRWHVSPHGTVTVWTDASSLGMGVALEVDGSVAEDASWLRKESDHRHINVAELEAVARGINLAISWGFKTFTVATDSRTVISWMDNTVEGHRRVRTKGASEMLIKRRLGVIRDTITEFGLTVTVRFVSTTENKADRMTRVPKKWLGHRDTGEEGADVSAALATGESVEDAIWAAHLPHHLGVDRTLYLARQIRSNLTREQVKRELVGCEACQRIDPARREENLVAQGSLAVDGNWRRVAVDVTHYGAKHYLSMVDCGPSRFAIWRRLSSETAASIIAQLQGIVIERGPCDEFLLDNSTAFSSHEDLQRMVQQLCKVCKDYGMSLHAKKTKVMTVSKTKMDEQLNIYAEQELMETVTQYKYLGNFKNSEYQNADVLVWNQKFGAENHQSALQQYTRSRRSILSAFRLMLDQIFGLGTSNIKLHTNTNKIRLEKGVRQGDSISPKLFTACLENVFRGLNWTSKGIPINGDRLTNLRFADDVVLFSESPQELQLMVEELRTASSKVGLEINLNRYFQNSIKMPVDTKRICGPDQSSPYYLYSQLSQSSTDKKNVVDQKRDQEKDLYKLKPMFLTGGLSFGNDDGGAVMYFFVIRTGVVSQAKGSAYIEIGNIKIIASVYGPREVLKKRDFNINGQLNCEVKYAPYSCPNIRRSPQGTSDESELSTIVCDALKPAVCMQKFPKSRVDVFVIILETGDSAVGEVITCASLAIADAGIEMYDVVIGSTLKGGSYFAKKNENKESKSQDHGSVTVGLLPSLDQVSCFIHKGEISSDNLSKVIRNKNLS